jgi:hypothetical protein
VEEAQRRVREAHRWHDISPSHPSPLRQNFVHVSMMRRALHSPPRFSLCLAGLERPLWSGTGLGRRTPYWITPGWSSLWDARLGPKKCPMRPKNIWGKTFWGTRDWRCSSATPIYKTKISTFWNTKWQKPIFQQDVSLKYPLVLQILAPKKVP